jgi:hypothetical protein
VKKMRGFGRDICGPEGLTKRRIVVGLEWGMEVGGLRQRRKWDDGTSVDGDGRSKRELRKGTEQQQ